MQVNHLDVVQRLHAERPPEHTVDGALAFTLRVIAALPADERAGLLLKPAGENIAAYLDMFVSAGRICYPDGQLYKVLSDIPTTLAPIWDDNGTVDPSRYVQVPVFPPLPPAPPLPPPPPPPVPEDFESLLDSLERIYAGTTAIADALKTQNDHLAAIRSDGVKVRLR
jgi:hypothetical protein